MHRSSSHVNCKTKKKQRLLPQTLTVIYEQLNIIY